MLARRWADEEKRSICLQTAAPAAFVTQLARRYSVNANLIFKWPRDPKYRPEPGIGSAEAGLCFLPAEIVQEAAVAPPMPNAVNHIEIELVGGHRMRTSGKNCPAPRLACQRLSNFGPVRRCKSKPRLARERRQERPSPPPIVRTSPARHWKLQSEITTPERFIPCRMCVARSKP